MVKSTAGPLGARKNFQVEVGPQEKVARAEVKRMKGGPQKEVAEVAIAELVEVGAGDEVAATHHTLTRRCSSAGDIRSMSPTSRRTSQLRSTGRHCMSH